MGKIALFFLLSFSLILSGCTTTYDEDYTKTHKQMLDHFLGDWTVENTQEEFQPASEALEDDEEYISWDIRYKASGGKEQTFHIVNNEGILYSLHRHLLTLYFSELRNEVGTIPDATLDLVDAHQAATINQLAYEQNPDKVLENYKDVYDFKNFQLQNAHSNSGYYFSLSVDDPASLEAMEAKILSIIPNLNMVTKQRGTTTIFNYYINGKNITLSEHPSYDYSTMESMQEIHIYEELLRKGTPHYNIEDLYKE
ncbi:hypothetical protein AM500_20375 [Bacillus sp. FJAT-18017]|uniref:hypothetical protein n=1 Tax=Bacillus sp. FJAT-18017 TaxID=1705566 RepID=UPI0006AF20AF|nr:hypothetical protein [Bacillus sp. FJAT-18017]ALC91882.1 hypothetical protein AM500_20375 [Bacillus sp. FJAT-18017]